jgi:hypothetical protein
VGAAKQAKENIFIFLFIILEKAKQKKKEKVVNPSNAESKY